MDVARLAGDIRQAVAERHELQLADVQLLEFGSIPKTSSGKVRRQACREDFLAGRLEVVASSVQAPEDGREGVTPPGRDRREAPARSAREVRD